MYLKDDRKVEEDSSLKDQENEKALTKRAGSLLRTEKWRFLKGFKITTCRRNENIVLFFQNLENQNDRASLEGDTTA